MTKPKSVLIAGIAVIAIGGIVIVATESIRRLLPGAVRLSSSTSGDVVGRPADD